MIQLIEDSGNGLVWGGVLFPAVAWRYWEK